MAAGGDEGREERERPAPSQISAANLEVQGEQEKESPLLTSEQTGEQPAPPQTGKQSTGTQNGEQPVDIRSGAGRTDHPGFRVIAGGAAADFGVDTSSSWPVVSNLALVPLLTSEREGEQGRVLTSEQAHLLTSEQGTASEGKWNQTNGLLTSEQNQLLTSEQESEQGRVLTSEQEGEQGWLLTSEQNQLLTSEHSKKQRSVLTSERQAEWNQSDELLTSEQLEEAEGWLKSLLLKPSSGWWDVTASGKGFVIKQRWRVSKTPETQTYPRVSREQFLTLKGMSHEQAKETIADTIAGHLDDIIAAAPDRGRRDKARRAAARLNIAC